MVTLRTADTAGELSFRSDAGEQICTWIGQQCLQVLRRPAVFPVRFGDSAAELHIVDAGVKLIVQQELVRYCTFTDIRSWWNDPKNSTLSIVPLDYRTLVLGCDEHAQAANSMAEKSLAVAQAVHRSTQSTPPRSLAALPEGVPERAKGAAKTATSDQESLLKRDVHVIIQQEEEQADGTKSESGSESGTAQVQAPKLESQQSAVTQEAATIAASYEEQLATMQATIAAAHAEAAGALEEAARQRAAAEHASATEMQELEAARSAAAAAAQKEADAMQSAMRQTIEKATLQAQAEAKAASQAQVKRLEAEYQTFRDQGSATTAQVDAEAKVHAIEAKYEALLAEQAAAARQNSTAAETEALAEAELVAAA